MITKKDIVNIIEQTKENLEIFLNARCDTEIKVKRLRFQKFLLFNYSDKKDVFGISKDWINIHKRGKKLIFKIKFGLPCPVVIFSAALGFVKILMTEAEQKEKIHISRNKDKKNAFTEWYAIYYMNCIGYIIFSEYYNTIILEHQEAGKLYKQWCTILGIPNVKNRISIEELKEKIRVARSENTTLDIPPPTAYNTETSDNKI